RSGFYDDLQAKGRVSSVMMDERLNPFGEPMANAPKQFTKPSDLLKDPSIWIILVANLFPIYAIWVWYWDLFTLILLYWCEALVLVLIQGLKMCVYYPSQIRKYL